MKSDHAVRYSLYAGRLWLKMSKMCALLVDDALGRRCTLAPCLEVLVELETPTRLRRSQDIERKVRCLPATEIGCRYSVLRM